MASGAYNRAERRSICAAKHFHFRIFPGNTCRDNISSLRALMAPDRFSNSFLIHKSLRRARKPGALAMYRCKMDSLSSLIYRWYFPPVFTPTFIVHCFALGCLFASFARLLNYKLGLMYLNTFNPAELRADSFFVRACLIYLRIRGLANLREQKLSRRRNTRVKLNGGQIKRDERPVTFHFQFRCDFCTIDTACSENIQRILTEIFYEYNICARYAENFEISLAPKGGGGQLSNENGNRNHNMVWFI